MRAASLAPLTLLLLVAGCGSSHEAADAGGDARASMDADGSDAGPLRCPQAMADCDGVRENGCEVDLRTDDASCGECGRACEEGARCADGLCDGERVVSLAIGYHHACIVRALGQLDCWGDNEYGQIGDGTTISRDAPTPVMDDAVAVDVSDVHSCALGAEGGVWCWGTHANGALGVDESEEALSPVAVPIDGAVDGLAAGGSGTCQGTCVVRRGRLTCWGSPVCGLRPDERPYWQPYDFAEPTEVEDIVVGRGHNCALLDSGDLWCWGVNNHGQLGHGAASSEPQLPQIVDGLTDATDVGEAGGRHTCAVRADGSVWCWGKNNAGQLGDGTTVQRATPTAAATPDVAFVDVATGLGATCAVDATGAVWCWGRNDAGQLGDGTAMDQRVPQRVPGIDDAVEIQFGWTVACAVHASGALSCWGGVLEDSVVSTRSPTTVVGLR